MRKPQLIRYIVILCYMLLMGIHSCYAARTSPSETVIQHIKKTHTINLGYQSDAFPFSYTEQNKPTGFSIDVCTEIVNTIKQSLHLDNLDIHWVNITSATQFIYLQNRQADVICLPDIYTENRAKISEFSRPFFFSRGALLMRRADKITALSQLAGHSILVKSGTVFSEKIRQINQSQDLNLYVELEKSNSTAFHKVEDGRYCSFYSSLEILRGMVAKSHHEDDFLIIEDKSVAAFPGGLLLPINDKDFKSLIDESLSSLMAGEKFIAIYKKWFEQPVTEEAINLNIPMSLELKLLTQSKVEYHYF